jgi:transcriptional regulator with XRE-family HTH domain
MSPAALDSLAQIIRQARESKGLSQRALSERVGIPQGHISRIENGSVDLQASSLIQIARALDLELALIPRRALSTVQALYNRPSDTPRATSGTRSHLSALLTKLTKVSQKRPQVPDLERLRQTLLDLRALPLEPSTKQSRDMDHAVERLTTVLRDLQKVPASREPERKQMREFRGLERVLRNLRNALVHGAGEPRFAERPAYALDEDEDSDG